MKCTYPANGKILTADMYDDIHPNSKGEKIMAQRWFDAMRGYLKKLS